MVWYTVLPPTVAARDTGGGYDTGGPARAAALLQVQPTQRLASGAAPPHAGLRRRHQLAGHHAGSGESWHQEAQVATLRHTAPQTAGPATTQAQHTQHSRQALYGPHTYQAGR